MKKLLGPLALLLIYPAAAEASSVTERLQKGEIISVSAPGSGVRAGRAMAVIEAPPRVVRDVLTAFDNYRSFVPRITASRRVKQNRYVVEVDLPWPVNKTWAYLQVDSGTRDGIEIVTWKMLNGTLKLYEGAAWIQPWGKGRSLITYQMLAVPHTAAPNSMMTNGLREAVGDMVGALRKQVQRMIEANPNLRVAGSGRQG